MFYSTANWFVGSHIFKQVFGYLTLASLLVGSLFYLAQPASADVIDFGRITELTYEATMTNDYAVRANMTPDGRYVVFSSFASNHIPGDNNNRSDVFRYDRVTGTIILVSKTSAGNFPNDHSGSSEPVISDNGCIVAFDSWATDLVPDDENGTLDIFVRDVCEDTIEIISMSTGEEQANDSSLNPSISPDGRFVAFESGANNLVANDNNGTTDIFVHDRTAGTTIRVSVNNSLEEGNSASEHPSITSSGGDFIVSFTSGADNLVASDTNEVSDIFVYNSVGPATTRASVSTAGDEATSESWAPTSDYSYISADGCLIVFSSYADNLVAGDTNDNMDIFVRNRCTPNTQRVSLSNEGNQVADPGIESNTVKISSNGRYVSFASWSELLDLDMAMADNFDYHVYVRDIQNPDTYLVSTTWDGELPNSSSMYSTAVSNDGTTIGLLSYATDLMPEPITSVYQNLFVSSVEPDPEDVQERDIVQVRFTAGYTPIVLEAGNGESRNVSVTPDGRYVVFETLAKNLLPDPGYEWGTNVYVYDTVDDAFELINVDNDENAGSGNAFYPSISDDGRYVVFVSSAYDLVPDDNNGYDDIFIRDRDNGTTERINLGPGGVEADYSASHPMISGNGNYVVFTSRASNLIDGDNDVDGYDDIFLWNRNASGDKVSLVSVNDGAVRGNGSSSYPRISADGNYIVFVSLADNLTVDEVSHRNIYVRNVSAGTTTLASHGSNYAPAFTLESTMSDISDDGRYVTIVSANDLEAGSGSNPFNRDDIFLRDMVEETTIRISVSSDDVEANDASRSARISGDGKFVVFESYASNLIDDDQNGYTSDIFLRDLTAETTELISVTTTGDQSTRPSTTPFISSTGEHVVFLNGPEMGGTFFFMAMFDPDSSNKDVYMVTLGEPGSGGAPPTVVTEEQIFTIGVDSLEFRGTITDIGSDDVTMRGFEYGTTSGVYTGNVSEAGNFGTGLYALLAGSLACNTTYYYRAVAENEEGVSYGGEESASTMSCPFGTAPTVQTNPAQSITQTTAIFVGDILQGGDSAVSSRGFEYGLTTGYGQTIIENGISFGTGEFDIAATLLTCATTYHYRAYASNSSGTGYGADQTFTTAACDSPGGGPTSGGGSVGSNVRPNGTLILDGHTVYLIMNGKRYGFRSEEEYHTYGYNFTQVVEANYFDLLMPGSDEALKALPGALVLDTSDGRTVYMIGPDNTKRGFVSERVFFNLGYGYKYLYKLDLSDYPTGPVIDTANAPHPEGSLVIDSYRTIWWILNNKRHGFESMTVLASYGFEEDRIIPANQYDLALPQGELVKIRDGTLIKYEDMYYIISEGKRLPFVSLDALRRRGYKLENVMNTDISGYEFGYALN